MTGSPGERSGRPRPVALQETPLSVSRETIKVLRRNLKYFDEPIRSSGVTVLLTEPIERVKVGIEGKREQTMQVYSYISVRDSHKSRVQQRYAIVGNDRQERLPPVERIYWLLPVIDGALRLTADQQSSNLTLRNIMQKHIVAMQPGLRVIRARDNPEYFTIENVGAKKAAVEATVAMQAGLKETEVASESIPDAADRFPKTKRPNFSVEIMNGSYAFHDRREYGMQLKQQVKRVWMTMAEEFDFEPRDFPVETVRFWAERPDAEIKHLGYLRRRKERNYRRTFHGRSFFGESEHNTRGTASIGTKFKDSYIHTILIRGKGGEDDSIAHELMHRYIRMQGVNNKGNYGDLTVEGLASAVEISMDRYYPIFAFQENDFAEFKKLIREGKEGGLKRHDPLPYQFPNQMLHLYLLKQRGGIEMIRHAVDSMGEEASVSRETLLAAYQATYGESVLDLLAKARTWYEGEVRRRGN